MAGWPVYSTRFLEGDNVSGLYYVYVPNGYRWVLKHWSVTFHSTAPGSAGLFVASRQVSYAPFQVAGSEKQVPLMCVAYAGDRVQINLSNNNMYSQLSGFMFAEPPLAAQGLEPHFVPTSSPKEEPLDWGLDVVD